jgi:hypothetical protein
MILRRQGNRSLLPKWAQEEMRILERQRDEARADAVKWADRATGATPGSPVTMRGYGIRNDVPLPRDARIRFGLPVGEIEVYLKDGRLELYSCGSIGGTLEIRPHSANVASVAVHDWRAK